MIGLAERQIANEADDGLDQGPAGGGVEKVDDGLDAVVETHGILCHLRLHVP